MAYLSFGNKRLHYLQLGTGSKLLLAFHGYGDLAGTFSVFGQYLGDTYTLLCFDLPHHGGSNWPEDEPFTLDDLVALVGVAKAAYHADKVSLMGYSLGGRICLAIVAAIPASVDKVVLMATDGLAIDPYYRFFTRMWLGKNLFRHMLLHPQPYFRMLDTLKSVRLVHPARHKFVMHALHSVEARRQLLQVWPCLSQLVPEPAAIKAAIKEHSIPVSIFMGKNDMVMPPLLAEHFNRGLSTAQLYILEKGHRIFDAENAQQIADRLL